MSYIDDQITDFFNDMVSTRWDLEDYERWMRDYEKNRYKYPDWVTQYGNKIKIYELSDSHLDNIIPFAEGRDPNNETHWVDVLKAEKKYRTLVKKVARMKEKLANMEYVSDLCF